LTNYTLAQAYLIKAQKRLKILDVLFEEEAYSDVVREAQEVTELALKGILRQIGVEPPKQHDVGPFIVEHKDRLPKAVARQVGELARISKWLRKEREFSFYGDTDFVPTEEYGLEEADRARRDARTVVAAAADCIPLPSSSP